MCAAIATILFRTIGLNACDFQASAGSWLGESTNAFQLIWSAFIRFTREKLLNSRYGLFRKVSA